MDQELEKLEKSEKTEAVENQEAVCAENAQVKPEVLEVIEVNKEVVIVSPNMINEGEDNQASFHVVLSLDEKIKCIEEILSRVKKILYVYDKSQEENSAYNYKVYIGGILIYVSSSNVLFRGDLVSVVINLNAILINDFSKPLLKRIVFETKNMLEFMLKKYNEEYDKIKAEYADMLKGKVEPNGETDKALNDIESNE